MAPRTLRPPSSFLVSTDVPATSKVALVPPLEFVLILGASVPESVEVVFCLDAGALGRSL